MSVQAFLLLLYPALAVAAPKVFFWLWPNRRLPALSSPAVATDSERTAWANLGALVALFTYGILIFGTLAWQTFLSAGLGEASFFTNKWLSSGLASAYLGAAWAGISIWLLALGGSTGRMRREIPGVIAPLRIQVAVWLLRAIAEEAWRVIAIAALLKDGFSPAGTIVAVSIAFGAAYLSLGLQRFAVAILDGGFFGFLFLWRGAFLAPLIAHLAVQAVYLWGVGQLAFNWQARKTWQISGTKCPVCSSSLKLLQIKLSDVFECPSCRESLSVSDTYQNIMRFAGASVLLFVIFCSYILARIWLSLNEGICALLSNLVTLGIETSGLLLYRKTFTRLFPPRLQRGTPYFITMHLGSRLPSLPNGEQKDKEEDSSSGGS